MHYPFWDAGLSYGILMASVAILHVFVSHFAIGGGLFLVVGEQAARKAKDLARLEFLQRLSKFFVLVTLVTGALTGVGIWFIIGLLNPTATEALIHNFVWGWAIEWTFFVVEITAAILYYYGWKSMSARSHLAIGWIYFLFAWLSLVIINGILTFMLTPGKWLLTGDFWDGFFNPTYWPSLILRTAISILLAGLYALTVAARYESGDFKGRIVRQAAAWGLVGMALAVLSYYWYWKAIPAQITSVALQNMPTPIKSMLYSWWLGGCIVVMLIIFGLLLARRLAFSVAVLLMALGIGWFGSFEWFRESLRKPYIISGYIYGNALEVSQTATYQKNGLLPMIAYRSGDDGADLFRHSCQSCHTINGYKALSPVLKGTDRTFIASIVKGTHLLRGNMPPFLGTAADADLIAGYIEHHLGKQPLSAVYGLQGVKLGEKVYQIRCAKCHVPGTSKDKMHSLAGMTDRDYDDMLNAAQELGEGMPAFTGSTEERAALIEYLKTLVAGGNK